MIAPDIVARRIGAERQPIAIVDHFHPDPGQLRALAATARFAPARRRYPGIRADLPPGYFDAVRPALSTVLRQVFDHRGGVALLDASFSMVTTPPQSLSVEQRLPHFDAIDPARIAIVHYLGNEERDGTAFYRHRATGFETIDAGRAPSYLAAINAELRDHPPPPAYIAGATAQFEPIATVEPGYNRAVIYRGALLHSSMISADAALRDDPARGRLTVTAFLLLT